MSHKVIITWERPMTGTGKGHKLTRRQQFAENQDASKADAARAPR
jgi:hypothetical protein